MARTFNETVPSVTDIFENAGIGKITYKFFQEAWETFRFDMHDGILLIKKTVFMSMLRFFLFNKILLLKDDAEELWNNMNEFINQSKSEYIVYE